MAAWPGSTRGSAGQGTHAVPSVGPANAAHAVIANLPRIEREDPLPTLPRTFLRR